MRSTHGLTIACLVFVFGGVFSEQSASGPVFPNQPQEVRDLRVGEHYSGGIRVRSPLVGVSFVVPTDWRAALPAGSVVFLDSAVIAGLGTIHLLTEASRETVRAQLSEPQSIEAGFVLHPVGSLQEEGPKFIGQYAAGDDVGIVAALLGPSRNAIIYQFVGRKSERDLYQRLAEEMAAATQFMNEQDMPTIRAWYERLTGMMLAPQLDSRVAQSIGSTAIHLCSDGRFIQTIRLEPVAGRMADGEEGGAYQETGIWRIDLQGAKAKLVMTKSTGGADQHDLHDQDNQLLWDGQIASVAVSNGCL